ncbi:MAG: OmpA family protein [Myxococcales bacterium]|nr:OmpA family protein [Myxococcales bacterium]
MHRMMLLAAVLFLPPAEAAEGKTYKASRSKQVHFPLGDLSFADEVVAYEKGKPAPVDKATDASRAMGPPDYDSKKDENYVTLGCSGTLTLRFSDNALVDSVGDAAFNQKLSEGRAAAVRDHLRSAGLGEIGIRGFGASRPIASSDTEEGRERNRRVEVLVVPKR